MRVEFEMSEAQLATLMAACKPTPAMYGSGGQALFGTPQENANRAWQTLGTEMGFQWDSAQAVPGKGERFFTAIKTEPTKPVEHINVTDELARCLRRELSSLRSEYVKLMEKYAGTAYENDFPVQDAKKRYEEAKAILEIYDRER